MSKKSSNKNNNEKKIEGSKLLQAIELILADPAVIKRDAKALHSKFTKRYSKNKTKDEIADMAAKKLVSNYSYSTAFVGAVSALAGIIPGIGTAISIFGGATTDAALTMKYQIEMTMSLAVVYDHDIKTEEQKRLCLIIAGLGATSQSAKEGGKKLGEKAFIKLVHQYLKGATLQVVKEIFKKVGITFTRKALEKSIPFGVGVLIGFTANKVLTSYVGKRAIVFFKI